MKVSNVVRQAQREQILDRLANDAEQSLHRDVEGRRAAGHRLLKEMHQILTKAAVEFEATAYPSTIANDGSLVVGDAVTVTVTFRGDIRVFTAGVLGDELPEPAVRFNARRRVWEHRDLPQTASPIDAIIDVIQCCHRSPRVPLPPISPGPGSRSVVGHRERGAGSVGPVRLLPA